MSSSFDTNQDDMNFERGLQAAADALLEGTDLIEVARVGYLLRGIRQLVC